MAEKPQADETAVPDFSELTQAIQDGTATAQQMKAVETAAQRCPVCGEPRGGVSPCPHCGMR